MGGEGGGGGEEEEKESFTVVYSRASYQGHEIKSKNSDEQFAPKTDHDLAKICSVVSSHIEMLYTAGGEERPCHRMVILT